ncbi:MAG: tetratricopeptide repeat protein [Blastocatellia bacterium]|nr:tetratricopeptide repeat protein [Blastocatellia bacterium]
MMRFCTSCGIELVGAAKFCRQCGAVIESPLEKADPFKTQFEPTERLSVEQIEEKLAAESVHKAKTEAIPPSPVGVKTVPMPPSVPTDAQPSKITSSVVGAGKVQTTALSSGKKWIALGVPAFVLIVLCVLFFSFNYRKSSAEPTPEPTPAVSPTPEETQANLAAIPAETPTPSPTPEAPATKPSIKPTGSPERPNEAVQQPTPAQQTQAAPVPVQPIAQPANAAAQPVKPAYTPPEVKPVKPALTMQDHWRLGAGYLGAGRNQEALNEFEQARRLAPGNVDLFYLIGTAYNQMGRYDEALAAYRQCTSGVYASVAQNHVKRLEGKGAGKEEKKKKKY